MVQIPKESGIIIGSQKDKSVTVWRGQKRVVEGDLELVVVDVLLGVELKARLVQELLHCFGLDVGDGNLVPMVLHPNVGTQLQKGPHSRG